MTPPEENHNAPVRMKEVAALAGVSRMTASAVLMGTGEGRIRVSEQTAERVRQAAQELGYRPNQAARQLAGKRSDVVALVLHDLGNFMAQKILAEFHRVLQADGLQLLTVSARNDLKGLEQALQDTAAGWVGGVVYLAHENESQWPEVARMLRGQRRAVAVLGDLGLRDGHGVVSDVRTGAAATVKHLVQQGRRRIVLLTEELESRAIQARIEAYSRAMLMDGLAFAPEQMLVRTRDWHLGQPAYYGLFDDLAREIVEEHQADALICDTDFNACGLLRAFRRLGIRVPEQVAVVGWGDLQFAGAFDPPLTTVTHDLPALLQAAVEMIRTEVAATPTTPALIPTRLVIRETT